MQRKVWTTIVSFGIVVALVIGIFEWDNRYAKCADLKKMEHESVKTFTQFQAAQSAVINDVKTTSKIQYLQLNHQWIQNQISNLRMKITDKDIKLNRTEKKLLMTEYNNLLAKEKDIKNEIDETLSK